MIIIILFLNLCIGGLFLPTNCYAEDQEGVSKVKLIFAHYMVCCPTAGPDSKLEDYMNEIRDAQLRGIDGFALNCGAWSKTEPYYKKRVLLIYKAAQILNTGFKLFISVDMKAAKDEVEDVVDTVRYLPNQLYMNKQPVLSTFGGYSNLDDEKKFVDIVKKLNVFFVPYFFSHPTPKEIPDLEDVHRIANLYPMIDGFFYFGAAGTGKVLSQANKINAQVWRSYGKLYMASVTPFYLGGGVNFRVFETNGFTAMAQEWETAINNNVDWIEIVTWNDWDESTYVAPFSVSNIKAKQEWRPNSNTLPHVAYLDASKYYIEWFKSGRPPLITRDEVFYFYRPHKINFFSLSSFEDFKKYLPDGWLNLNNDVFVTVFLKAPATVVINSGVNSNRFELLSGVSHVSIPAGVGVQEFSVIRKGKTLIHKIGEMEIDESIGRLNYFSGEALH